MADLDPVALQNVRDMVSPEEADELLKEVIDSYLQESPKQLTALREAIAMGDHSTLIAVAHSLKASSASLGATGLAQLCEALEVKGQSGQISFSSGEDCIAPIAAELERVVATLQYIRST